MAEKRRESKPSGPPQVDLTEGKKLLEILIKKGQALLKEDPLTTNAFDQWNTITENYLERVFGKNDPNVHKVTRAWVYGSISPDESAVEIRIRLLTARIAQIEALVEVLDTDLQLRNNAPIAKNEDEVARSIGHKIFLVHGHDKEAMLEVKQFLTELDLDVTILHEQPNEGRTIIEKFEDHADVDFAVALLTPDDMGGLANASDEPQQPRPRQNVIFEMGYFFGLLGRSRVCALYKEGVELPSDYSGILYVKMDDDGGWRLELAKELRTADFAIDMNKLIR